MKSRSIRTQITFHEEDLVFPIIVGLLNNPTSLRKRLHYLIHLGVRADEKLPQIGQQVAAHHQEAPSPIQSKRSTPNTGIGTSTYVVPNLDLGGLTG